ncbi:MAG: hypothetical protein LKG19_15170 [Saprospiraceae bacterium]|jgi:hypothetical protein|nr:hypothetical protein [Saprospiraceae bacterium]
MLFDDPQFPNSQIEQFLITSPQTSSYNCIAWAFGDDSKWYWPDNSNIYFWPSNIPRQETLNSFIMLFESIGYTRTNNGDSEPDFEKIAIYGDRFSNPTHAARQMQDGLWTSKLGQYFDVTHTIFSLSNGSYGNVLVYMKRQNIHT